MCARASVFFIGRVTRKHLLNGSCMVYKIFVETRFFLAVIVKARSDLTQFRVKQL